MTNLLLASLVTGSVLAQQTPAPPLKASMIVLGVADIARSVQFYKETLALPQAPAPGDLPMFRSGDLTIVLNAGLSNGRGGFELVFPVESVDATRKRLAERGCQFVRESRMVAPNSWVATFTDPDGHRLTLFGPR